MKSRFTLLKNGESLDIESVGAEDGFPGDFALRSDGIYDWRGDDGAKSLVKLCSPLRVLAMSRDHDGANWGRLVEVVDPDGKVHRVMLPARLFAGDGRELSAELFSLGLQPAPHPHGRARLLSLLNQWRPNSRALIVTRLGWVDSSFSAFTLGDGAVIGATAEQVHYQTLEGAAQVRQTSSLGTLEDWREGLGKLCGGNPLLIFSISAAFAGPLLEPLKIDGGGVHMRGPSSCGKSTMLQAAESVWGSPLKMPTWRATTNGLEGAAADSNATLLVLDELGQVDGKEAGGAMYMLANGQGKARASKSGSARPIASWRTIVLSSGEIAFEDKMAEAGRAMAAGQEVRMLDIQADAGLHGAFDALHGFEEPAAFANAVRAAATSAYGLAGPAFVECLLKDWSAALAAIQADMRGLIEESRQRHKLGTQGQAQRALARIALVAAAGEAATRFGLTGWSSGDATSAAKRVFALWIEGRGGSGPAEAREAVRRTRAFITKNAARFQWKDEIGEHIHDRAGWRDNDCFYVATDTWKDMHKGADAALSARYVHDAGHLEQGDGRGFTKKVSVAGKLRPRAYAVRASIIEAE